MQCTWRLVRWCMDSYAHRWPISLSKISWGPFPFWLANMPLCGEGFYWCFMDLCQVHHSDMSDLQHTICYPWQRSPCLSCEAAFMMVKWYPRHSKHMCAIAGAPFEFKPIRVVLSRKSFAMGFTCISFWFRVSFALATSQSTPLHAARFNIPT